MSKNLSNLSGRKGVVDNLFEKISTAATENPMSQEALDQIAEEFLVGKANIHGAITFYDFLKPENKDKKVYVCNGSACLCAGTQEKLHQELTHHFKEEEIGHMTCLGRCHENGAFHYNGKNYSASVNSEFSEIFSDTDTVTDHTDQYHVDVHGPAILTAEIKDVDQYYNLWKKTLLSEASESLDEIIKANLRGRGGAGFPIGLKLESCRNADANQKFIICNADEGDPGAYSDRYLMEHRPHAVLFGMMVAGYITGANWGILYIRGEYPESVQICNQAIQALRERNLIGKDILGSGFDFDFKVIKAQGAYICGEETALINSIEGQRPEVRIRPPYPTQQGLFNKPTVVNNVETLASIHYILEHGGAAYRDLGTDRSSGTKLMCLDSLFNRPGLYEVEMGTSLSTVIYELGGGFKRPVKAMQIGGPLGGIVPVSKVDDLTVDFETFNEKGFLLGHASVVSIPEDFPIIKYLEHLFDFASYESCGKCFPCRLGTKRGHEMLMKAASSGYKIDMELFEDLLTTLQEGSLCAHGGGIPLPVWNCLQYFKEELNPYFTGK